MKTASEIKNALDCIKYYNARVRELSHQQFVEDCNLNDINTQVGSLRFDALGAIGSCCGMIDLYGLSIEKNLETAVKQDKLLHSEEDKDGNQ